MSLDRNQQVRDDFRRRQELHKLQQQFAQALAAGQVSVIDRIGQKIEQGALVVYRPPHDFVYEVKSITPILDPRVPPGQVQIVLDCTVPVVFMAGQPIMGMIRVGTQHAPGHASLDEMKPQETATASMTDETIVPGTPAAPSPEHTDEPPPSAEN